MGKAGDWGEMGIACGWDMDPLQLLRTRPFHDVLQNHNLCHFVPKKGDGNIEKKYKSKKTL